MNYCIREARSFERKIDELENQYSRIRELKAAISFALCIDPNRFSQIDGEPPQFRVLRTDDLTDLIKEIPLLDVVFEIIDVGQEKIVELIDLKVIEPPPDNSTP